MKKIIIEIDAELKNKLDLKCVKLRRTKKDVVTQLIINFLKGNKK